MTFSLIEPYFSLVCADGAFHKHSELIAFFTQYRRLGERCYLHIHNRRWETSIPTILALFFFSLFAPSLATFDDDQKQRARGNQPKQ